MHRRVVARGDDGAVLQVAGAAGARAELLEGQLAQERPHDLVQVEVHDPAAELQAAAGLADHAWNLRLQKMKSTTSGRFAGGEDLHQIAL